MTEIRRLREAKGISQRELAKRLGVTQGAVSQWESGETFPSTKRLLEVAGVLKSDVSELLRRMDAEDENSNKGGGTDETPNPT